MKNNNPDVREGSKSENVKGRIDAEKYGKTI